MKKKYYHVKCLEDLESRTQFHERIILENNNCRGATLHASLLTVGEQQHFIVGMRVARETVMSNILCAS